MHSLHMHQCRETEGGRLMFGFLTSFAISILIIVELTKRVYCLVCEMSFRETECAMKRKFYIFRVS